MSGKSPQKETKSTDIKSNFLSIQLWFLFRQCRKRRVKNSFMVYTKNHCPQSLNGTGLYSNGNRLLLLSVFDYCDCCVCGDWGGFLFFGRVQLACDYGVCGDCNAIDLVTVMLVRYCCARWAIHTGCKSGCEMVTLFDSDIDDWPQCDCEQHSPWPKITKIESCRSVNVHLSS